MIWKLLGWQKRLDALFDDGWVSLGVSDSRASVPTASAAIQTNGSHV